MNKLVTLFGCEPGCGRKTLAKELSRHWADSGKATLWVSLEPSIGETPQAAGHSDLENWVPRFKSLSPLLLRNYLQTERSGYSKLCLNKFPSVSLFADFLKLVRAAFEWSVITTPASFSAEGVVLLDHTDLLLWIAKAGPTSESAFRAAQEQLTRLHFPLALSQIV